VNRAIDNIQAHLALHTKLEEEETRKHPRYNGDLVLRFVILNDLNTEEKVYQARVLDVSAGGVCIAVQTNLEIALNAKLKFSMFNADTRALIMKGKGNVARMNQVDQQMQVGIEYTEVTQS